MDPEISQALSKAIEDRKRIINENLMYMGFAARRSEDYISMVSRLCTADLRLENLENKFESFDVQGIPRAFAFKGIIIHMGMLAIQFLPGHRFQGNEECVFFHVNSTDSQRLKAKLPGQEIFLQHEKDGGEWVHQFPWSQQPGEWWKRPGGFKKVDPALITDLLVVTFAP